LGLGRDASFYTVCPYSLCSLGKVLGANLRCHWEVLYSLSQAGPYCIKAGVSGKKSSYSGEVINIVQKNNSAQYGMGKMRTTNVLHLKKQVLWWYTSAIPALGRLRQKG
jgi:hypothetical protein